MINGFKNYPNPPLLLKSDPSDRVMVRHRRNAVAKNKSRVENGQTRTVSICSSR